MSDRVKQNLELLLDQWKQEFQPLVEGEIQDPEDIIRHVEKQDEGMSKQAGILFNRALSPLALDYAREYFRDLKELNKRKIREIKQVKKDLKEELEKLKMEKEEYEEILYQAEEVDKGLLEEVEIPEEMRVLAREKLDLYQSHRSAIKKRFKDRVKKIAKDYKLKTKDLFKMYKGEHRQFKRAVRKLRLRKAGIRLTIGSMVTMMLLIIAAA